MHRAWLAAAESLRRGLRYRCRPAWLAALLLLGCPPALSVGATAARAATTPPAGMGPAAPRPGDLRDVNAWVAWKNAAQIDALPAEARLFFRRGLIARQSGQESDAISDLRGAIELDPSFIEPHVTLASWALFTDPAQTLLHTAQLVELWRHDFNVQLDLVANALILCLESLFAGLLFAGLFIIVHRRHELAHPLHEELARVISPFTARWWVPVILILPFLAGAGLTLPVLALLGFLWPNLRARERALTVMLAAAAITAPITLSMLDRCTLALASNSRPFYELPLIENTPGDPERLAHLEHQAGSDPRNGFAQFALAWTARRTGRLDVAERAYRAALAAWPGHPAVLTNLGNVLAMRGHTDEALALYSQAIASDPRDAAAHFNSAQLHMRRFEYTAANQELSAASTIDFEHVRDYQARAGTGGLLPLMDVWPPPRTFWSALGSAGRQGPRSLPLVLRGHLETAGVPFSCAAIVAIAAGLLFGRWQHRRLPLRACGNCGVIVCRRCAKRRRETALCPECERVGSGAETQEFSRVLLLQHRTRRQSGARLARTALAALVPGYGLLAQNRVFGPTLVIACAWFVARLTFGFSPPFSMTPRLWLAGGEVPPVLLVLGLACVYTWSLGSYFVVVSRERLREAQLDAATRGRITQSTRRQGSLAA